MNGEEVLTRDDPRHRFNGGGRGVNVIVQPTVTTTVPNTETRVETQRGASGEVLINVLVDRVEAAMNRRIGRGEGLAPTMERRYGLNPAAGVFR